jgi:hypothetical protein
VSDIRVGDLVVVVRNSLHPCKCPVGKALGRHFIVEEVCVTPSMCRTCGTDFPPEMVAWDGRVVYELDRLKRIPPLDELERDQIVKELSV